MAVRKNLSFSPFLLESMEILRIRRRYRTLSEYVQGLVRYDAQTQRDHTLSSEWASLNPREQSFLDAALLELVKSGTGMKGTVMERYIRDFVQKAFEAGKPEPTIEQVAMALGRSIGDDAQNRDGVEHQLSEAATIGFSPDLLEAAEILRKRRRYRKISEYIQGLARYDAQTQREHAFSAEWAALSPAERDLLDAAFLKQVKAGEGIRGSWLEARIYEIIMEVYRPADYAAKKAADAARKAVELEVKVKAG